MFCKNCKNARFFGAHNHNYKRVFQVTVTVNAL